MVKNSGNRISDRAHHVLDWAAGFIGVGALATLLIRGPTDAADRSEWAIKRSDDLAEGDFARLFNQCVPTVDATAAGNKPRSFECKQNLLQKFDRNMLTSHDVLSLKRGFPMSQREFKQGPKAVFTFL